MYKTKTKHYYSMFIELSVSRTYAEENEWNENGISTQKFRKERRKTDLKKTNQSLRF